MNKNPKLRVGTSVRFTFGLTEATGVIANDNGPRGVGGRQLYGIKFTIGPDFSSYIELPESSFEVVGETPPLATDTRKS